MVRKFITSLILFVTGLSLGWMPMAYADFLPVKATADDTVAGYATVLKSSQLKSGQSVIFVVEKPDTSVLRVTAEADIEGIAKTDLYGHQTKLAGTYKVALTYPGSTEASPQSTFKVFPDQVSMTQSMISSNSSLVEANGSDLTVATVTLYDAYRNPVSGHKVSLISSRTDDQIQIIGDSVTDDRGRASFKVTSKYPGVSVLTALDQTTSQVLSARKEIVFMTPTQTPTSFVDSLKANLLGSDIGQSDAPLSGPVDHFDIQGLPSTVKVGDELTVTVIARDRDNNVAKNYVGTILFSAPSDDNAILPNNGEYTFKESDQGQFKFNLALEFSKTGPQVLQVVDKNNWQIKGEIKMDAVPKESLIPSSVTGGLEIKTPVDGSELASSTVVLTGKGKELINVKVFDNDSKIGDTATDSDGFFNFQAQNLQSGPHTFYVMSDKGEVSPTISVTIDTVAPVIDKFELYPDGVLNPGDKVTLSVRSEPDLQTVKVRVQGIETDLMPKQDQPGLYQSDLTVPAQDGIYTVDVILVDRLSNKTEIRNQGTIQVVRPEDVYPPTVEGLTATAEDSAIVLNWKAVESKAQPVSKYRIFYGTGFDTLDKTAETEGPLTTLKITGLENGTQYFFAVKAVDIKNNESQNPSDKVALTPVSSVILPSTADLKALSLGGGAVQLTWTPFAGARAAYYKIYFGFKSGEYSDFVITPDSKTEFIVTDLIHSIPYYFAVTGLDVNGLEISPLSIEASTQTSSTGFYPSAPTTSPIFGGNILSGQLEGVPSNQSTGSEALWIVLLSLLFAHFFYFHKRKLS